MHFQNGQEAEYLAKNGTVRTNPQIKKTSEERVKQVPNSTLQSPVASQL
jgi:hypothetical protein